MSPWDSLEFDRTVLRRHQEDRLQRLINAVLDPVGGCRLYREKYESVVTPIRLDNLSSLPILEKPELTPSDSPTTGEIPGVSRFHYGNAERYVRYHQTSGTTGNPLVVLDTQADWEWWIETWQPVLDAAEITSADRVLMAFSFGPFIGFWSANDALVRRGCLVIPAGGMSSIQRLELMARQNATVLCCTPTYAMHLAEVSQDRQFPLAASTVNRIIVAGEPGGSVPSVRQKIQEAWSARVIDHSGASELGPWGFGSSDGKGLYINEAEFLAEFAPVADGERNADLTKAQLQVEEGVLCELLLTGLGRQGGPAIRYRTGDLVRPRWASSPNDGCPYVWLEGGVLGRCDDMVVVRGVNIFPSSIEAIVRSVPGCGEFRILLSRQREMDQVNLEVEGEDTALRQLEDTLAARLGLRVGVQQAQPGSLPRFEAKARRLIDNR